MREKIFKPNQIDFWRSYKTFLNDLPNGLGKKDGELTEEELKMKKALKKKLFFYFLNTPTTNLNKESLMHSIEILFLKNGYGVWQHPKARRMMLQLNPQNDTTSVRWLLDYTTALDEAARKRNQKQREKEGKRTLPGLKPLNIPDTGYKLYKVLNNNEGGDSESRRKIFENVTVDMGNCLGGSRIDKYLDKTARGEVEIYLMSDQNDKFQVAIEYDPKNRSTVQIKGNKSEYPQDNQIIKLSNINVEDLMDLNKYAKDQQICSRLGIQVGPYGEILPETDQSKLWTLEEVQLLMQQQMFIFNKQIKEGELKTDGYANIFYVKTPPDKNGKQFLRSFYCRWASATLEWCVESCRFGCGWRVGARVFSRNKQVNDQRP